MPTHDHGRGGDAAALFRGVGHRTFGSVLASRNYRLFLGGQLISQLGSWTQKVAQVWFVLNASHSGAALGLLVVCQFTPYTVFGLLGGALSERFDPYRVLIATQTLMMTCAAALTWLAFGGSLQVWEVDLIAVLQGTVMIVDTPVRQAFVRQMVGKAWLSNAIALNVSVFNLARILGPALGGIAIASIGVRSCFLANAISFLAVLAGLLMMRPEELHRPSSIATHSGGAVAILRDAGEAMGYAWRTRRLLAIVLLISVVATLGTSFNITLPLVAQHTLHGNAATLGMLMGCYGAGALAGALAMATLGRTSWWATLLSCCALGVLELLLAPQRTMIAVALILAAAGIALSCFTSNASATLQHTTAESLRTRMLSLYSYGWIGTAPAGGLLTGWLSDQVGPAGVFTVAGITMIVVAAAAMLVLRSHHEQPLAAAGVPHSPTAVTRWSVRR